MPFILGMCLMIVLVIMGMLVVVMVIVMMRGVLVMVGIVGVVFMIVAVFVVMAVLGVSMDGLVQSVLRCRRARGFDDVTLNPLAVPAPARTAMAGTAARGAVLRFFLRLAMGALIGFDQRLTIGDGDLIVIGMNFAEGEKAVAIASILDEGGLQRRFDPRDLRQIDIAAQLFALRGLEIKFFDAVAADHDDPGLLRVGGIDKHFVGHFGTLDGGGRAGRRAQIARPGDATVHLIRG
jgi:hypothetical protein